MMHKTTRPRCPAISSQLLKFCPIWVAYLTELLPCEKVQLTKETEDELQLKLLQQIHQKVSPIKNYFSIFSSPNSTFFYNLQFNPDYEINMTGLQPVLMTVEQVHYFGGWVEDANPFGANMLQTDKHIGLVVPDAQNGAQKFAKSNRQTYGLVNYLLRT